MGRSDPTRAGLTGLFLKYETVTDPANFVRVVFTIESVTDFWVPFFGLRLSPKNGKPLK
jgi:hypothetical protein